MTRRTGQRIGRREGGDRKIRELASGGYIEERGDKEDEEDAKTEIYPRLRQNV